jgi:hypothetical protein
MAASPAAAGGAPVTTGARASGSRAGGGVRTPVVTSRTQRKPNTTAITAPTTATTVLTTSPARTHAMPTANPIGQRLGGGRCGVSLSCELKSVSGIDSTGRALVTSTT